MNEHDISLSRRKAIAGGVALLLAGCGGGGGGSTAAVTPTPTPTPTPSSTSEQGLAFSNSTTNISRVTLKGNSLTLTLKIGRTLRVSIPTVGSKSTRVVTMVKPLTGKSVKLGSVIVTKNKGYLTPGIKFTKAGTYTMSITVGSVSKKVVIKVPRS